HAPSPNHALVLCENNDLGQRNHVIIFLVLDHEIGACVRMLRHVGEEVGEVVEIGFGVVGAGGSFDEEVKELGYRVWRGGEGFGDAFALEGKQFERVVGFCEVGEQH